MIVEEKTISSERIYSGKVVNLRVDTVELPDCKYQKREIVEHKGAVGVIAVTNENKIVMVKQFRKPIENFLIEIPAGKLEKDEDPKSCAIRELKEETGYTCKKMKFVTQFYTSAGFSNEKMYLFVAKELEMGESNPDEDEYVDLLHIDMDEAIDMMKNGAIKDAKSIIGILMAKHLI